jgi:predicted enzyme related to lactoylglutathione lyase
MAFTQGLIEIILYVQDMAAMVGFYRNVLGLAVQHPQDATDVSQQHWVTFATGACTLALHSGGQEPPAANAPEIVFLVEDVQAARQQLVDRGVAMGEVVAAAPGILVCGGRDPEGHRFAVESRA